MAKRPSLATSMKALAEDTGPDLVAIVGATKPKTAATRVGMKRVLIPMPPQLHKRLKRFAVEQDTTIEAVSRTALESYLASNE